MAAPRRSTEDDSATRSLLLDAAQELMLEEGYAAVTTRRVADRAGVNKALVFYYFGTMDDLFLAVFRRGAERTLEREVEALQGPQPLWAMWDMAHYRTNSDLTLELTALSNHRKVLRAEIADYSHQFRKLRQERIQESLKERGIDIDEWPAAAVVVMLSGISRFLQMEKSTGIESGHDDTVAIVERMIEAVEGPRIT